MATHTETAVADGFEAHTYAVLIGDARRASDATRRWQLLEAAHVVGQQFLRPHVETHSLMLALALRTRDWGEAAGQLLRLLLVPLGHLSGRLPLGNPGRATVSAFEPIDVRPDRQALIAQARAR